jgi:hypothetical protein
MAIERIENVIAAVLFRPFVSGGAGFELSFF